MTSSGVDLSVVVVCGNDEPHLDRFLTSAERQALGRIELVFVLPDHDDATRRRLAAWASRTRRPVVCTSPAVESPRQAGLAASHGTWVMFPTASDTLERGCLAALVRAAGGKGGRSADALVSRLLTRDTVSGAVADTNPLRDAFGLRSREITPDASGTPLPLDERGTAVRRSRLLDADAAYADLALPGFGTVARPAAALRTVGQPRVLLVPGARVAVPGRLRLGTPDDGSWADPRRYDEVLRGGMLGLLDAPAGERPGWLDLLITDQLARYFALDAEVHTPTAALSPAQSATFLALARQVLSRVDRTVFERLSARGYDDEVVDALRALGGATRDLPVVACGERDRRAGLRRVTYPLPEDGRCAVTFAVAGRPAEPIDTKRRGVRFFGATVYTQGVAWVPDDPSLAAFAEGVPLEVRDERPVTAARRLSPHRHPVRRLADASRIGITMALRARQSMLELAVQIDARTQRTGARPGLAQRIVPGRHAFAGAWILMDRDDQAHDNAEHLYRYLRAHRPDIRASFVLRRDSRDWDRLAAEGFRLIRYGSPRHVAALVHAREYISSQVDHYVISPPTLLWLRRRPWRFSWLQHGTINYDLSNWLNTKQLSLFVTTTVPEFESVAGDGSAYRFTTHETVLTGQPRHDALVTKAAAVTEGDRRAVVFMPTWRRDLLGDATSNARTAPEGLWETEYVRNWLGLLGSPTVHDAARATGCEIVFMPHPTMAAHLTPERLPAGVHVASYADDDVQQILAHASHVVTDYSSNAFEAALIERPVMYFQFDRDSFFGGEHIGRRGYFDYERDGFGPVATTLPDAERALASLIAAGRTPQEPYASRIAATFPLADGRACERVVRAIETRSERGQHEEGP